MKIAPLAPIVCVLLVACHAREPAAAPRAERQAKAVVQEAKSLDGPLGVTDMGSLPVIPTDSWIGPWMGVEGLALDIQPAIGPGQYALHITLLDGAKDYIGVANGGTIRFTRAGKDAFIRRVKGEETGLKWLANKRDCLMIQAGEAFCRD